MCQAHIHPTLDGLDVICMGCICACKAATIKPINGLHSTLQNELKSFSRRFELKMNYLKKHACAIKPKKTKGCV